jgi:hypothetical protein
MAVQALCNAEVVSAAALHEEPASDVGRHGYISAAPEVYYLSWLMRAMFLQKPPWYQESNIGETMCVVL